MPEVVPDETRRFTRDLARRLSAALAVPLVGVYLHGSAVLGDFQPAASDVDVLVVVRDRTSRRDAQQVAGLLASADHCPGIGLEATVVEKSAARTPTAPWPYRVHVTTDRRDPKTVWCGPDGGDSDLILHYAVTRESGWSAHGPLPAEAFGPIARDVVRRQLAAELRWAAGNADESYTVLNACRALRYCTEGLLYSKTAGGIWALEQGVEPELVGSSLTARESGHILKASPKAASFALGVADTLEQTP